MPPVPKVNLEGMFPPAKRLVGETMERAQMEPDNAEASGRFGMVLLAHRFPDVALPCFERARRLKPEDERWHYYAGVIHFRKKEWPQAGAAFRKALKIKADLFPAKVLLAEALFGQGDLSGSREWFEAALKDREKAPRPRFGLAMVSLKENKLDEAKKDLEAALAAYPQYDEAKFALGGVYRKQGNAAKAAELLAGYDKARGAKEPAPAPFDDPMMRELNKLNSGPDALRNRARSLASRGRFAPAIKMLEEGLAEDAKQAPFHLDLIQYYSRSGMFEKADASYREAAKVLPDDPSLHQIYGDLQSARKDTAGAIAAYTRAIEVGPTLNAARLKLAHTLASVGRAREAEPHLRKILETEDMLAANVQLGLILSAQGRHAEALPLLLKGNNKKVEDEARLYQAIGAAYQATGQEALARENLARAKVLASVQAFKPEPAAKTRPAVRASAAGPGLAR